MTKHHVQMRNLSKQAPREAPLGPQMLKLCVLKPPQCPRNACRRTCPAPTMMRFPGLHGDAQLHAARGFAPLQEEWDVYLDAAKHVQAADTGVENYVATHQRSLRCAKGSRKLGRIQARRVG
eukprot:6298041-Amphidinium_carterae.1